MPYMYPAYIQLVAKWSSPSIRATGCLEGNILTFPDPPCQPDQIFWSKIACTGVPHIVLHVLCSTRTSGGHFRPHEVGFRAIFAVLGDLFHEAKTFWVQNGLYRCPTYSTTCFMSNSHLWGVF